MEVHCCRNLLECVDNDIAYFGCHLIKISEYMGCCSEYSMQLNASRIKVLQAQDDLVNSMKDAASEELLSVSSNQSNYKLLLKNLIVQVGQTES